MPSNSRRAPKGEETTQGVVFERAVGKGLLAGDLQQAFAAHPGPAVLLGIEEDVRLPAVRPDRAGQLGIGEESRQLRPVVKVGAIAGPDHDGPVGFQLGSCQANSTRLSLGQALHSHEPAAGEVLPQHRVEAVVADVFGTDDKDVPFRTRQILDGPDAHGHPGDGDQRLGEAVARLLETLPFPQPSARRSAKALGL